MDPRVREGDGMSERSAPKIIPDSSGWHGIQAERRTSDALALVRKKACLDPGLRRVTFPLFENQLPTRDHSARDAIAGISRRLRRVIVSLLVHDDCFADEIGRLASMQCCAIDEDIHGRHAFRVGTKIDHVA